MVPLGQDFPEIREGVRAICAKYPGEYWRKLEKNDEYADAFVNELSAAGYLGALIPEEYGGSGLPLRAGVVILEEIHASGCSAAACHAQMYMMGTLLRHGSEEQKRRYLPGIATGEIRFQAFGVTEPTTGSDTTQLKTRAVRVGNQYVVNGQKLWTSRAHKSDLMLLLVRTTPVEEVKRRTEGLSVLLVEMRDAIGQGLTIRRVETMINHQTNELFFDDLKVPPQNLIGEE
ncbi:MAG: acyl-CoA dehydrogenase family protein, partial [Xanthobacteraceae bacterium]|nr:acyl-CoA dehydrogenase family protein [Xanthobacteraceae bacterium]